MIEPRNERDRELVLAPGSYAYFLDSTKGDINVVVGPHKVSLSGTDQMVKLNPATGRFDRIDSTVEAIQSYSNAPEGSYIVLENPVEAAPGSPPGGAGTHPKSGTDKACELRMGRKVNIPGPAHFPLWPGQIAKTLDGHHLHHNQYVVVRVYNEDEAKRNWGAAVMKPTSTQPDPQASEEELARLRKNAGIKPADQSAAPRAPDFFDVDGLTMGQLIVVKGTDVSFYIPPTGIEVIPEDDGKYVREAVTLERLEYCILLSETGDKRYVQGPAVVFPKPTEGFLKDDSSGTRKFKAIELNEHSGLYIKVIADYSEDGHGLKAGQELFVTGKEQAIYFPREEQSVISYGKRMVHYAIAIPAGEGRYVLDRDKGTVDLVIGPQMFLPDPRTQVLVRRVLDAKTVGLLFPGNAKAAQVNAALQTELESADATQYAAVSSVADEALGGMGVTATATRGLLAGAAPRERPSGQFAGDAFTRSTTYTAPRSITLDSKYEGAVTISPWTGYAVLLVTKTGKRRVVIGPTTVLLDYDESPMSMSLSSGKPKTTDNMFHTAYLRTTNNAVSDIISVETKDLVQVEVKVIYRANFTGDDPERWFAVENYVKFATDHMRSRIRSVAKTKGIEEFYGSPTGIIRDAVLGGSVEGKRPGMTFPENALHIYDVEILEVKIQNSVVAQLLTRAQNDSLAGAIEVSSAEQKLDRTRRLENTKRQTMEEINKTADKVHLDQIEGLSRRLAAAEAEAEGMHQATMYAIGSQLEATTKRAEVVGLELEVQRKDAEQNESLKALSQAREVGLMEAQTAVFEKRAKAMAPGLVEAINTLGDKFVVEHLTKGLAPLAVMNNTTVADMLSQIFKDTPFSIVLESLAARPRQTELQQWGASSTGRGD